MMNYMEDNAAPNHEVPERTERDDEKTALIPSSLCPDLEPGDEITLRVVATHQDEYEVKYLNHESESEEEGEGESAEEEQGEQAPQPSMARAADENDNASFMD